MAIEERDQDDEKAGKAGRDDGAASIIGVLGAGTMGSGIAQLAARAGARTLLYDPLAEALMRGLQGAREGIAKEEARGRIDEDEAAAAAGRLEAVEGLEAMSRCDLVIEAAPESLELKHELLGHLSEIVSEECVLASNTSSIPVTAIAGPIGHPERVVGMHFFNPAPLMRLLEVIAGERSGERALVLAVATGEAMGKTVIRAADGPGFLVNRCNRPFGLEALRLLAEQVAEIETIDRICRMEGGFRMGPFELMDLVGVDTGLEVAKSFYALSFGEPRWRPSPITARYVAAGMCGRKSGRGYYDYSGAGGPYRSEDPGPVDSALDSGEGVVVISGAGALAEELRSAADAAGYEVRSPHTPSGGVLPSLAIECGIGSSGPPAAVPGQRRLRVAEQQRAVAPAGPGGARILLCASGSLSALDPGGSAVGFHALSPLGNARLIELTRSESSSPVAASRAERFFNTLGKHIAWVGDAPGLVLGRIVCQVINESAFALGEGVGSARDIDLGMVLGLSHPRGPFQWADEIGLDHVLAVLDALHEEYGEERYRAAPVLRRLAAAGRLGRATGAGFFEHAS